MRSAFRRTGWALAAACGVSVVPLAIAQTGGHGQTDLKTTVAASEGNHKATEVKVELAWLDDPATFPCQIAAQVTPSGLEIRGFVPSQAVRERATRIARQNCSLPVIDHLHVESGVASFCPIRTKEQLRPAIAACMQNHFGGQLEKLQVTCNDRGEITVKGEINTIQERLAVSKHLQSVAGCTCVHNLLHVPGDTVEPIRPVAPPAIAASAKRESKLAEQPKTATAPRDVPPPTLPPVAPPLQAKISEPKMPQVTVAPAQPPAASKAPEPRQIQAPPPPSVASSSSMPPAIPWPVMPQIPAAPVAVTKNEVSVAPVPAPPMPVVASRTESPVVPMPPLPVAPPMPPTPPTFAAAEIPKPPVLAESYVTTGELTMPDVPQIAQKAAVAIEKRKTEQPADAYVTTGVVMVIDEPAQPGSAALALTPYGLKRAIETACGPRATGIEIRFEANNRIAVRFNAPTTADAEEFKRRVQALPEVRSQQVDIKVLVKQ
jgi:osmotically-inducible protein OsmY